MKTPFFTPRDFTLQDDGAVDLRAVRHAAYANEKFDKMIAQGEAVYAALWSDGKRRDWIKDSTHPANVYKGVVIFIEEIKPKCEKHEPDLINQKIGGWFCKHCRVLLEPTWSAK